MFKSPCYNDNTCVFVDDARFTQPNMGLKDNCGSRKVMMKEKTNKKQGIQVK